MLDNIVARLRRTLESRLLQKYALWIIVSFIVFEAGWNITTTTFSPALVDQHNNYTGNPLQLAFGLLLSLIGAAGFFYYGSKWLHGSVVDRSSVALEEANEILAKTMPSPSPVDDSSVHVKLNIPDQSPEFYSFAISHRIHQEYDTIAGKYTDSIGLISLLGLLTDTYAYQHRLLTDNELTLISRSAQAGKGSDSLLNEQTAQDLLQSYTDAA